MVTPMTKKRLHPLQAWLTRTGTNLFAISKAAKIPFRTVYNQMRPTANPQATTIIAIEDATDGEVTAQAQIDWIRERNK
jgi:hypothetical protein